MSEPRAWSMLTVEGTRQYGGNVGYDDDPAAVYRYDSDVANHLRVQVGDVVFIRSKAEVLGLAEVELIDTATGEKERLRCPTCRATNIKERARKLPRYSCKLGHQFAEPLREKVTVTTFAAHYGTTFVPLPDLHVTFLHAAVLRPSDQMSIKELDLARLEKLLPNQEAVTTLLRRFALALPLDEGLEDREFGSLIEARRRVLREIAVRRGQAKFRKRLLRRYGGRCQITGCSFVELVEAAHIRPYSQQADNGELNGLLLRSDVHTLFDLGYLGINPETRRITVHPALHPTDYAELDGSALDVNGTGGPNHGALTDRWMFFLAKSAGPKH